MLKAFISFIEFYYFPTQLLEAAVRGVPCLSLFERFDARLTHVPRRLEIRLADRKRDDVIHLIDDVEKLADPRRFHALDRRRQFLVIMHQRTISLPSFFASTSETPFSYSA